MEIVKPGKWHCSDDLLRSSEDDLRRVRGMDVDMIFQDPYGSLNPRMKEPVCSRS